MNDDLKKAIDILAKRITESSTPDEALKFTQAALNLANAAIALSNIK
jgi:hypothetical protein